MLLQDYIDKGHAEKVPKVELEKNNGKVWYLPHQPVTYRLKPGIVRVVFDWAARYEGESFNMQLLQGTDQLPSWSTGAFQRGACCPGSGH